MTIEQLDVDALTPLMKQYAQIKSNFGDAVLFFQVGDFYELFWEDAKVASAFLGIALTKRGTYKDEPIPLCWVPIHALDHYLNKLVKGGFKVALCDQMEEPKPGMIVRRSVTQVLTPGTLTDSRLLDDKSPSYLMSFFPKVLISDDLCKEFMLRVGMKYACLSTNESNYSLLSVS